MKFPVFVIRFFVDIALKIRILSLKHICQGKSTQPLFQQQYLISPLLYGFSLTSQEGLPYHLFVKTSKISSAALRVELDKKHHYIGPIFYTKMANFVC